MAGEIFIVEAAGWNVDTRRRGVFVAAHQRGDVVDALLLVLREYVADPAGKAALVATRFRDHRHIGRHGAVARARRLVVRKRRREGIGKAAGTIFDLALIVRLALDLVFGGDGGRLRGGEAGPAGIRKRAEGDQFQRMAGLADFTIDLEAALKLCTVELAERARERPLVRRRWRHFFLCPRRSAERSKRDGESEGGARAGHAIPHAFAGGGAGAPMGLPSRSTDSEIELGSGLVLSIFPSTGRITRKKTK